MNAQIDQLVKSLLQKDSIDQCSVQELQQYAERHPYFGAAQLLLTKKLKTENAEGYDEQLQKTLLYFHNPVWVQQLLGETGSAMINKQVSTNLTDEKPMPALEIAEKENEDEQNISPVLAYQHQETVATISETTAANNETENTPGVNDTGEIKQEEVALSIPEPVKPIATPKEELLFEPFHTVDYFASQGIKIREDEKPKDKFGQQLRSFTEWLKTMKRLPVTDIAAKIDTGSEQKVEQLAETSLKEGQVYTEAMAEVWEKQGNAQKAIDIYTKLSLLEPSKNAYFAAKIEELKKKI